jgi:hypothetical protein
MGGYTSKCEKKSKSLSKPFHSITITYKVAVYAPAEGADTLTVLHLYRYMYSVVGIIHTCRRVYEL